MSKGYEQFKKVDAELDKLLLYIEKIEEDYAEAISNVDKNWNQYRRYKEAYEIFHDYFDSLPDDVKKDIDKQLIKLDL
tara:strand:- start:845 stop:1078 length:234 start_codon:yes stop_codon:yes gene_type:complete